MVNEQTGKTSCSSISSPSPAKSTIPFFLHHEVFFVASEAADGLDSADMIATQYLQRVMSVQRAIETANFTSIVDGQVSRIREMCSCLCPAVFCVLSELWADQIHAHLPSSPPSHPHTLLPSRIGCVQPASFDSLCFKPIEGEGCLVESSSQYWLNDPVLLAEDPSPSLTASCQTLDPFLASRSPCMDKVGNEPDFSIVRCTTKVLGHMR